MSTLIYRKFYKFILAIYSYAAYNTKYQAAAIRRKEQIVEVNIKLEFANKRELERMIDLSWKLECPMKDGKCVGCLYHESCLKLQEIAKRLEIAQYMKVSINLEFRDAQDLRKTIEALWRSKCP